MDIDRIARDNEATLKANRYPGRGIVVGLAAGGASIIQVYWIMGRSANSRNRILVREGGVVRTKPFDESKVSDPTLIIYPAAREHEGAFVVTNGDQTDTIRDFLARGKSFEEALATREFEPDEPNWTARISAVAEPRSAACLFKLSVLKRDGASGACLRALYAYPVERPGFGRMIHTYAGDGNPLPAFEGEPRLVTLPSTAADAARKYWGLLDPENRVALFARSIDRASLASEFHIINAHAGESS